MRNDLRRRIRILLGLCGVLTVVACGPLLDLGGDVEAPAIFSLRTEAASNNNHSGVVLRVDTPSMPGEARGLRIPVSHGSHNISFYGRTAWSENATEMLVRVIGAGLLANTNFPVVGSDALDVKADCRLATSFSRFHFRADDNDVELVAGFRLIGLQNGTLIGQRSFRVVTPVAEDRAAIVVRAYDDGMRQMNRELASWLTETADKCRTSP